ncbi:MATE efflux family protein [Treponema primitia ZAS-2]|uniref:Multidrug-efflux transporter n=1 Tax=Treponema primitia (strain ATCC BAA-887 / DSM 12427 / ZAS-2) TaxID=545694 RepID=F5YJH6_TREPZ|nr:MATE family efflux transporter [Treponema primitia]AEF86827.1 MATE efflux family protein [Treponema primitia ZAS-2]
MSASAPNKYSLTEGGILSKLLQVALPIMGTQFLQMAYNLTDMFWLGRVGSDAVAASGAAGMYMWLSMGFLLIGRMGAEIGVSQALGRGDKKAALGFSQNAMLMALFLGLLYGLCLFIFNRELAGFYNFREPNVAGDAAAYLSIVAWAIPATFFTAVITGSFNASGNSRTPFIINGIGLAANVILDPVFIFVLRLEVRGAAIATVISQLVVAAGMFAGVNWLKGRPFERYPIKIRIEKEKIAMMLKWAVPIGVESLLFCFLSMVTSRIEASFGAFAMATGKVGSQIESLSWLIGGGFGSALIAFIGQNYGAGKWDRIRRGVRISALLMTAWGIFVTLLLYFAGGFLFSLFLPDPELVQFGTKYLRILAFCQLAMNLEAVSAGAFKGTGRTMAPSAVSIISNLIRPFLALILSRTSLGLYGVWVAVSITAIIRGAWISLWYVFRKKAREQSTGQ